MVLLDEIAEIQKEGVVYNNSESSSEFSLKAVFDNIRSGQTESITSITTKGGSGDVSSGSGISAFVQMESESNSVCTHEVKLDCRQPPHQVHALRNRGKFRGFTLRSRSQFRGSTTLTTVGKAVAGQSCGARVKRGRCPRDQLYSFGLLSPTACPGGSCRNGNYADCSTASHHRRSRRPCTAATSATFKSKFHKHGKKRPCTAFGNNSNDKMHATKDLPPGICLEQALFELDAILDHELKRKRPPLTAKSQAAQTRELLLLKMTSGPLVSLDVAERFAMRRARPFEFESGITGAVRETTVRETISRSRSPLDDAQRGSALRAFAVAAPST